MAAGLATAAEDDGAAGDNPFINFTRRHSKEVRDGGVEDISIGGKYLRGVLIDLDEIAFELCEAFGTLSLFFGAVTLAVTESPQVVTVDEEGVQDFAVPDVGFILSVRELAEGVIVLEKGPGRDDAAAE